MSGGHFNYAQSRIEWEIAQPLWNEICKNEIRPDWVAKEDWEGQLWSDETIKEFHEALEALRKAYVYAQRIDWLLSYDDGEDTFHERLAHDLKNYKFNLYEEDEGQL